jgi:Protein of unknown function (DUF2950)
MIHGFALAFADNSGVMRFIVNYDRKLFQKDLGGKMAWLAAAMKECGLDSTWT